MTGVAWLLLTFAVLTEVAATTGLRFTSGFTRPLPTVAVLAGYGVSFWLTTQVLRYLTLSTTYAVWSAAGTALTAVLGIAVFSERLTPTKVLGLAIVIAGVAVLSLSETPPS